MISPNRNLSVVFTLSLLLLLSVSQALFSTPEAPASVQALITTRAGPVLQLIPFPSQMPPSALPSPSPHGSHTVAFLKWNLLLKLKPSHDSTSLLESSQSSPTWQMRKPFRKWLSFPCPSSPIFSTLCPLLIPSSCHPPEYTGLYTCTISAARNVSCITRKFSFVMLILSQFNCLYLAPLLTTEFLEISI